MLLSETATVTWNSRNKKHYTSAGYNFTKMGDKFDASIGDLTDGCQSSVTLLCDYCHKEYDIQWYTYKYIHKKTFVDNDCCSDCLQKKAKDSVNEKYGGYTEMHDLSNDRRKATNVAKYGHDNPFASDTIKEKIKNTNIAKYGVAYTQQSDIVRAKTRNTCLNKYGVENYVELFKGMFVKENSPCWKGGVEFSRVERATNEYKEWRLSVFNRDNYTCTCCGSVSGRGKNIELHAHHINNWKDNPEMRYDVENGSTLCSVCHYEFHSIYGKSNNNRKQFNEFINNRQKDMLNLQEQQLQELPDKKSAS